MEEAPLAKLKISKFVSRFVSFCIYWNKTGGHVPSETESPKIATLTVSLLLIGISDILFGSKYVAFYKLKAATCIRYNNFIEINNV